MTPPDIHLCLLLDRQNFDRKGNRQYTVSNLFVPRSIDKSRFHIDFLDHFRNSDQFGTVRNLSCQRQFHN